MKPVTTLVKIRHGSHLYGTNTPSSDEDYKSVHLPAGRSIILGRAEQVIEKNTKKNNNAKNTADDIDDTSYSLQKFLDMVMVGDTVGTEILFADKSAIVESTPMWDEILSYKNLYLNRQCKGFVGYCQRQAAKYGIKGSRMAACKDATAMFNLAVANYPQGTKLGVMDMMLQAFCANHEFSSIVEIPSQQGVPISHFECVDRKIPYTASIKEAYNIYSKVYENYGERARAAMNNEGIDWKAVSHAVRVARQAIELLTTWKITFPRPDASELLEIKLGKKPYSEVSELLESLVAEVNKVAETSPLPDTSDRKFVDSLVFDAYLDQVVQ